MPDVTPDQSPLPFMLGRGNDGGHFAYFGGGAIRRLSNPETAFLRDECKVKEFDLDEYGEKLATDISLTLFGR